jgi:hypothetical protein
VVIDLTSERATVPVWRSSSSRRVDLSGTALGTLLVLGSSLRDVHVQRIIRWSAGDRRAVKTFAIQHGGSQATTPFWAAAGVEILNCDLGVFVQALREELTKQLRSSNVL